MLKLEQIDKVYRTDEVETMALNHVDINIDEGEFVAVMGPSGCGKSTTMNMIAGMLDPSEGAIRFDGREMPAKTSPRTLLASPSSTT